MTLGESAVVPILGGTGMGASSGVGLGAVGGGIVGLLLGGLLGGNGGGLFGNRNNGGAADAAATSVVLNPAFQSLQQQIQTLQAQGGLNDIRNEMESMENTFATISSGQTSANAANFNNLSDKIGQVQTSQAAGNFTTLDSINNLGRDLTASGTQALINNLQNFNSLQNNLQNSTHQIITQGTANAMVMAQCCCEIKGLIAADGNATRALINDLNVQNLRDQLTTANGKVSNNEQNQYLLNTILTHIKPTNSVV